MTKEPFALPLRAALRDEVPYGAPQIDVPVLLNVNENPYRPTTGFVHDLSTEIASAASGLNRYPNRDFVDLRTELASYLSWESGVVGLTAEMLWAANGSNEIMLQILQAFGGPGATALSFAPTYSMYPEYSRDTLTEWVLGERDADFSIGSNHLVAMIERHEPSVILLASPNNPTGTALPLDIVELACATSRGIVVVDEAYAEFRRAGRSSALALLERFPNLVVTRTMSKAFAMAGARVGYVAASTQIIDALRVVRLPYHLSALTQAAARAALRHREDLLAQVGELREERDRSRVRLEAAGFEVAESDANFLLFGKFADRHAVWQGLLDRGVLIRETGPREWLRVSIGTAAEMKAFHDALSEVV